MSDGRTTGKAPEMQFTDKILMDSNSTSPSARDFLIKDSAVIFERDQAADVQARLVHLSRHQAAFEIQTNDLVVQASEALAHFRILINNRLIYSGKAVVTSVVSAGSALICQASLEDKWLGTDVFHAGLEPRQICAGFNDFLGSWQKVYRVLPEYKLVVADAQSLLSDLRLWLEQVELGIRSAPEADQPKIETEIAQSLRSQVSSALASIFERFEVVAGKIDDDLHPIHRAFGQRQLHSLLLCAPFIHRTFAKPLGYAGDYEMMNMIVRNGMEGSSLYAKLVNAYLLDQIGPQAVRNRVDLLQARILDETSRVAREGRIAKIFCIACGPAWEARNFIAESPLADHAQFDLLDFDEDAVRHTSAKIEEIRRRHHRRTQVKFVKSSVQNLLRGKNKTSERPQYDLVYCSGLYDYLNDRVIRELNNYLYDQVAPGGILVVGNFSPCTPVRNFIEHFLEWFLIYRDANQLGALAPIQAAPEDCKVVSESTGANIFLEARKPK